MEARAARVRAERVERAGRGGRDFIHSPGADKGVVSPRGVGSTADEKRPFAGVDEEKRGRAERRDALVRALDATRGRLRELQLRDVCGDAGALSRFRQATTTPRKNNAPDPADRFRPSPSPSPSVCPTKGD